MGKAPRNAMMKNMVCRLMRQEDLEAVMCVEEASFSVPWSKEAFEGELKNQIAVYFVAVHEETVIGYAGAWLILDEAHITNVAILPMYRKQGVGMQLMRFFIEYLKQNAAQSMTLEVRASNLAAQAMYQKLGFVVEGMRKDYYDHPKENALIMWLKTL